MPELELLRRRRARPWPVALAVVLGLLVTLVSFLGVRESDQDRLEAYFERETDALAMAARQRIDSHMDVLYSLRDLFDAEGTISRASFATFAGGQLERHAGIQALEWVPVVRAPERADFVAAARREGLANFQLTERDASGRLVTAGAREVYFPVFYVEPLAGNEAALGYAPALAPRDEAIARARDTARPAATAGFSIVQSTTDDAGVAVFVPVYDGEGAPPTLEARRQRLRGLVEGVVVPADMLKLTVEEAREVGISVALTDETAAPGQRTLLAPADDRHTRAHVRREVPLELTGRRWLLSFGLVEPNRLNDGFGLEWLVLIAGLGATGLLGGYLSNVLHQRAHVEELVIERTRALNQAKELDRLKSNFVSSVSHDLRTPLTSIMGYAEFLEDEIGGPLSSQQQAYVVQIVRGARRLEHLVDDLLDFARLDAGTFQLRREPADLGAQIQEVAESFAPQVEEAGLRLEVEPPEGPLVAAMDAARIERVLVNLLHNAIKFTPKGGAIRVSARREDGCLRCEVADTGIGIPPDQIARLFQRFSQLKSGSEKGGTGLGLSICRAIVEAHDGSIGVKSEPGQGSVFWFTIPAA